MSILGVGVVSRNTVDAAIEVANTLKLDVQLVASRRQVDYGGGYTGWDTDAFVRHVRELDAGGFVQIVRDHGGPWQGTNEDWMTDEEAMDAAYNSIGADIAAGFDGIHLDPSLHNPTDTQVIDAVLAMAEWISSCSDDQPSTPPFLEVGGEEQSAEAGSLSLPIRLVRVLRDQVGWDTAFAVAQVGTKVIEARNVGTVDTAAVLNAVAELRPYDTKLKVHNGDYMYPDDFEMLAHLGVGGVNVAPEYGVLETRALLSLLPTKEGDRFLEIAYESGMWKKWLDRHSVLDDRQRAILAGHYVFEDPEVRDMKHNLDAPLHAALCERITEHMEALI